MKIFTERKSGDFLMKFGFNVVNSFYVKKKSDIENAVSKIGFPCVVKIFGENVIHKKKLGGVVLGVKSYELVLELYNKFEKIKGFEGVVIQKEIKGRKNEFLIGLQRTSDFGHVVAFGVGGSDVEKLKKVDFRVCPFNKKEAINLIEEFFSNLSIKKKKILVKILLKFCVLAKKFPKIKELDINPLVISKNKAIVLDSRIVWENKNL